MGIFLPILFIAILCWMISKTSNSFMKASNYIGRNLSQGVRGASINAIASSMPEVFVSVIFLVLLKDAEGFSAGIGNTAGSAMFNSMLIPSVSVLFVFFVISKSRIKPNRRVIIRDGLSLIIIELVLILLINEEYLQWYHGLTLVLLYFVYLIVMFKTMKSQKNKINITASKYIEDLEEEKKTSLTRSFLEMDFYRLFVKDKSQLNISRAWLVLIASTMSIAIISFFLVTSCELLGAKEYTIPLLGTFAGLDVPIIYIAMIFVAAASSFPDLIISIKDAKRGNYDDAISNALGSNIFDICFAVGLPLFLFTLLYGPLYMPMEVIMLTGEFRLLLWFLTIILFVILLIGRNFGLFKSFLFILMYLFFVSYVIGKNMHNEIALEISDYLHYLLSFLIST